MIKVINKAGVVNNQRCFLRFIFVQLSSNMSEHTFSFARSVLFVAKIRWFHPSYAQIKATLLTLGCQAFPIKTLVSCIGLLFWFAFCFTFCKCWNSFWLEHNIKVCQLCKVHSLPIITYISISEIWRSSL